MKASSKYPMAAEGLLQRVHGGALPVSPATTSYAYRERDQSPQKASIASRAAYLVENGMVAVIGGGCTNVQAAEHFPYDLRATIVTHNLPVAVVQGSYPNVNVILTGRQMHKYTIVTVGVEAVQTFQRGRADLCLLGVCSLHPMVGISNVHYEETQVPRAMTICAGEVVALAASEKLSTAGPYVIGPLSELNRIITNTGILQKQLEPYKALGDRNRAGVR